MKTVWGEKLDTMAVLPEYPRPQMRRDSYLNLNGRWEYAIRDDETPPQGYDGTILVPFSPESELSGVNRRLLPDQTLWYRRGVSIPARFNRGRILLHFGAVDQEAVVYWNGIEVCSHIGGYTPFDVDITDFLTDENVLSVKVRDYTDTRSHSRGKQKSRRGGIWYTPQSGIWQTIWMESVPVDYIRALRITPLFDQGAVELEVLSSGDCACSAVIGKTKQAFRTNTPVIVPVPRCIPWTPEHPHLYDLTVTMGRDRVESYVGMRKFSVQRDRGGIKRLFLNNEPYFHNGLLDQGYYCDGMLTPPSDEAMIFDIRTAKEMGFNMLRKHIKIEPLRWYYHCDRLGMLVWQDMINGGGRYNSVTVTSPLITGIHYSDRHYRLFARRDEEGRRQYERELDEMIRHLYNTVSVAMWVPFNEGWGQFDAAGAVKRIRAVDTSRTVDHASGWHDQGAGDVKSIHIYFRKYRFKHDKADRAVVVSEFGGYGYRVPGHCFNKKDFGYKRCASPEELLAAYEKLFDEEILPAIDQGLCAAVYTQLTDVEDELNGLVTYDRAVVKMPVGRLREINDRLLHRARLSGQGC